MFCSKCGSSIGDDAQFCPNCSAPAKAGPSGPGAADKMKGASKEALKAFKGFALSPVGGLAPACESLPGKSSMAVGIVFGVAYVVCVLLGGMIMARFHLGGIGVVGILKLILVIVMPFVSIVVISLAARAITHSAGSLNSDCFVAGAALLPIGIVALVGGILGPGNYQVTGILSIFAGSTCLLMVFVGLTRISKMSDLAATIAIPLMMVLVIVLLRIMFPSPMALMGGGMSSASESQRLQALQALQNFQEMQKKMQTEQTAPATRETPATPAIQPMGSGVPSAEEMQKMQEQSAQAMQMMQKAMQERMQTTQTTPTTPENNAPEVNTTQPETPSSGVAEDQNSPTYVVRRAFSSLQDGDEEGFLQCCDSPTGQFYRRMGPAFTAMMSRYKGSTLDITDTKITGNQAHVSFKVTKKDGSSEKPTYLLRKTDEGWKIYLPYVPQMRGN